MFATNRVRGRLIYNVAVFDTVLIHFFFHMGTNVHTCMYFDFIKAGKRTYYDGLTLENIKIKNYQTRAMTMGLPMQAFRKKGHIV